MFAAKGLEMVSLRILPADRVAHMMTLQRER